MAVVWLNGVMVDAAQARVSALDRGLLWGDGLFETLRAYDGRLWAVDEHLRRLREGAEVLAMPLPADGVLREAMEAVLEANGLADAGVRVTVTRGAGPPDPHADAEAPPNVLVTAWPLREDRDLYERGAALVSLRGWGRALAGVKTTSYALSVAGRLAARRAGADDALFVTQDGLVLETTGANVLAVFGDRLVTPPPSQGALPGVTRAAVLGLAPEVGLRPSEEGLSLDDLFCADEVLLTSTLREVYPAGSLDGRELARGPWAGRLREALRAAVRQAVGANPQD